MCLYHNEHNGTYPCAEDPVSTDPFYWLWMGRGWRGLVGPYLGGAINKDSPSVLLCRSDPATIELADPDGKALQVACPTLSERFRILSLPLEAGP